MKWLRRRRKPGPTGAIDPLVLAITEPVTRDTAAALVSRIGRMAATSRVVIDLTAIPDFDSDGAAALAGLQESLGSERVTLVGLRQATARLVGTEELPLDVPNIQPARGSDWVVRRLRAITVVQAIGDGPASADGLEPAISAGLAADVGIVVIDLRGAHLDGEGVQAIAFASSTAAVRGQELLVVNVDNETAERLRRTGLSATTFLAPVPLPDS